MFWQTTKEFPVVLLYRHILKAAAKFPSVNRAGVIQEIKDEFRLARNLTDTEEITKRRKVAVEGLKQLEAYSGMDKKSPKWEMFVTQ